MDIKKIIKEEINKSRLILKERSTEVEDVEYQGRKLEVKFTYTPEEPEVRYYPDGSGYPGMPARYDILSIHYEGRDITKLLSNEAHEEIEELLDERRKDYGFDWSL